MERILVMDEKNYAPDLEEIYRVAVRGIIFIEGQPAWNQRECRTLLLIKEYLERG